jgi:endonuclease/exonuclease/phosphatase family metal-dependent hydrolase
VRVTLSIRLLVASACVAAMSIGAASAQTTLTLGTPDTHVTDTTIGSGTAASTVSNTAALSVRLSTDVNAGRRALLKFDTSSTLPAGTTINSAKLTVFVRGGAGTTTRTIAVYEVAKPFQESQATWKIRKTGYSWTTAGGDLATKIATISVPATAGTPLTVDVTSLVQKQVKDASSRYTRLALVDAGTADSTSFREFHSSESTDPAKRPKLVVSYGGSSSSIPPTSPTTGASLKVLHWNIHRGWGTDNKYSLDRIANWIVKLNPQLVSLNEVERFTSYANEDQPATLLSMLKSKTGVTWYSYYRTGNGATNGHGNVIFSRFPIISTSYCQLSATRVAANVAVTVNGRLVNFYATHLDSSTSTNGYRIAEVKKLLPCLSNDAEQRIIGGDFNAKAATSEIGLMTVGYIDSWAKAVADKTAYSYAGNTSFGATRNARIDYVFVSKTATAVSIKRAEVFDTRDASGYMPSDHKPLLVNLEVK